MKLEIYKVNRTQDWRWRVKSRNGRIVAASSEGFDTRYGAKRNLQTTLRHLIRLLDETHG